MFRSVTDSEATQFMKELDIYGYSKIESFLSDDLVDSLIRLVEQHYQRYQNLKYKGVPQRDVDDKILYNLQNKDKQFIDILCADFIKNVCRQKLNDPYYRFLPEDKGNYILSYYNARSSGKVLDLHIDSYLPVVGDRTWAMQVVFVLEDMTKDNGGTVVVPGSHKSGRYTDRELENIKYVEAKAGDLVIWDSRLWHGTTENRSKRSRWLLIATMTSWWIKQSMDITRSIEQDMYSQLSDEQKVLLGFCSIPPINEFDRINTKGGYQDLKDNVADYWVDPPEIPQ